MWGLHFEERSPSVKDVIPDGKAKEMVDENLFGRFRALELRLCLAKSAGHRGRGQSRSLNRNLLSALERGAKISWAGAPSLAPNEYVEKFFCIKHSVSPP
jgi:hypothetical protein